MQNVFKRVRIDRLFFGSFAAFIAVLLLVFTWISYTLTTRELADKTSFYQQDLLNELNKQLDIQLKSIEQMSNAASKNVDTINYDPLANDLYERLSRKDDLEKILSNITYSTIMVQSICLYMENPIAAATQSPVQFKDIRGLSEESWYPDIKINDFAWIPEHMIPTNSGPLPVISFARKIYNNSGKYYGMLLLNVKASAIQSLIRGETEGRSRMLLDARGTTITSICDPILSKKELDEIKQVDQKSGNIHLPADGREEALLVWSKAHTDWILVEATPWKEIIHGSVRLSYILLAVGLSAIVIALFFTLFLSRQFTRPIRLLLSIMGRFPSKAPGMDLPTDYKNEFGNLFNGYRRQMERIEELLLTLNAQHKRQREVEIQALQAMINPHFLYNTLDQLNWVAIDSGQEKISKILSLMGKMFRLGLSNGETMIPIQDEITHVLCYLEIQKIRLGERLTYAVNVGDEFNDMFIPRLTLQPFIENAIIHGFHGQPKGEILITAQIRDQDLEFVISDNGVGLRTDWDELKARKTGGYGIRNVKERMEAFFGAPYGVELMSREGQGTEVVIRLPKLFNKQEAGERFYVENTHYR